MASSTIQLEIHFFGPSNWQALKYFQCLELAIADDFALARLTYLS